MTRNAARLEAAFAWLVDTYPAHFADQADRFGGLNQIKRSMHILLRREQEGNRSVSAELDYFEQLCEEVSIEQLANAGLWPI